MAKIAQLGVILIFLNLTPALGQFVPGELDDYSPSDSAPTGGPAEASDPPAVDDPTRAAEPAEGSAEEAIAPAADQDEEPTSEYQAAPPPPPPPPPFALALPGPPAPAPVGVAYGYVLVSGAGVNEFYYVRQDHFNRLLGANNFEKLRSILSFDAFGPHPAQSQVRVRQRANYYFFPICNYQLSWARRGFANVPEGTSKSKIDLKCL